MAEAERNAYDRAIEWASWAGSMGSSAHSTAEVPESEEVSEYEKPRVSRASPGWAVLGSNQ